MQFLSGLRLLPVLLMVLLVQRPQDFAGSGAGFEGLHPESPAWSNGASVTHPAVLPVRTLPPVSTLDDRPEVQKESRYRFASESSRIIHTAIHADPLACAGSDPALHPSWLRPIRC